MADDEEAMDLLAAELKQSGVMAQHEGKVGFSYYDIMILSLDR